MNTKILDNSESKHSKIKTISLGNIKWNSEFWKQRIDQSKNISLAELYRLMKDPKLSHALTNLKIAAGLEKGTFKGTFWQDAWVYKWLESASAFYINFRDKKIDIIMDDIIEIIGKAQQKDGYIASQTTIMGQKRYTDTQHHELYTMGHLVTAACIHYRATNKKSFLNIAIKVTNYIYKTFSNCSPKIADMAHNPSIIMGSIELFRITKSTKYLKLAEIFINLRGTCPTGTDQTQDRVPFREETQIVGHAVFWSYLFSGVADIYMENGDKTLLNKLEEYWNDLVYKKIYITGGTSSIYLGLSERGDRLVEATGPQYFLPSSTAYNETCGQIGSFMWNFRMLLINPDVKYSDLMEQTLYNGILPGISLDGKNWFYVNILRCYGDYAPKQLRQSKTYNHRFKPGFRAICCPTNMLRTFAELGSYTYTVSDKSLWVHLFGSNTIKEIIPNAGIFELEQKTNYPWEGEINFKIKKAPKKNINLIFRIPSWSVKSKIFINGRKINEKIIPGKYFKLNSNFNSGDEIKLLLQMETLMMDAHPYVEELRNQVAVMRGPIVYCLEQPDLPKNINIFNVKISSDTEFKVKYSSKVLGGINYIECDGINVEQDEWKNKLYSAKKKIKIKKIKIKLIPYYAWANRGINKMSVWIPVNERY